MHGELSNCSPLVLVVINLFRQELSPLITAYYFDTVSGLSVYVSLVLFVQFKGLALFVLEVDHCFTGRIVNAGCHVVVAAKTLYRCWSS